MENVVTLLAATRGEEACSGRGVEKAVPLDAGELNELEAQICVTDACYFLEPSEVTGLTEKEELAGRL